MLTRCVVAAFSRSAVAVGARRPLVGTAAIALMSLAGLCAGARAQVVTIDTHGNVSDAAREAAVDRRFAQVQPTNVALDQSTLDAKMRLELIRILQSEQGFAMRPFPKGHKGLTLVANGRLEPAGEAYLNMVTAEGICAKPGDRVVITDLKFDRNKIQIMLNGGPDAKHRFLRHIQLGSGNVMNPVVQDDGQQAQGARLTLTFKDRVPELTPAQVKSLLAPLISFDVKTPIQAYTDTLPPVLKEAILNHHVMVGMSTEMVLYALGQPESKTREIEGQMPFEEWIYGKPPKPVEFVRINGNRVIRLEIASVGQAPQVFTDNAVDGLMRTDGTALDPNTHVRTVALGDATVDPNKQAAPAPPSLRKDGDPETAQEAHTQNKAGQMKPVRFPKQQADDHPDASKLPRTPSTEPAGDTTKPEQPEPEATPAAPPPATAPPAGASH